MLNAKAYSSMVGMSLISKRQSGFTIVELLIVIVVIAILATISVVAYNGVQARARDSKRASDVIAILKALESHRALYGNYPMATPENPGNFERSNEPEGAFMEYLTPEFFSATPVDPINNPSFRYQYYVYSSSWLNSIGCPSDKGNLMVFQAWFEGTSGKPDNDPTLACGDRSWSGNSTRFFRYSFENE